MKVKKWVTSTLRLAAMLGVLSACGEEDGPRQSGKDSGAGERKDGGDAGFDANVFVPPEEQLPTLPPDDPDSGAPPGAQFFKKNNPVIYLNDYPDSVYTDAYMYALAANDVVRLVGVISTGIDCKCGAGDNVESSARRQEWIDAARDAGFAKIPNNTPGTWGPPMMKPDSGVIAETARMPSAGSDLIVAQAKLATREVPLLIVSGGPITTLADAYLKDPSITQTIVVSWLAGSFQRGRDPEITLDGYNGGADRWATEIVLRNFRVFIFPTDLDPPLVSECRIDSDIPPSPLRDLLFQSGYFMSGRDADGAPAVTINFPAYMKEYNRISMTDGLNTVVNPNGNLWLLRAGDAAGGGEEFFRELRKAYKVPADAGSFASDAGCVP
ncbi:MAG TPA: hypothetical protein VI299_18980 [Polyangiales bacterium]